MARLSKKVIQRLAVLHAISRWKDGAYGPVRVQKTMFFADKNNNPRKRLLTFKKYFLGQYSDELASSLNALRAAGRLNCIYDGPAEVLRAVLSKKSKAMLQRFFEDHLPDWEQGFNQAFKKWGYLKNEEILRLAHDHETYTQAEFDEVIFESSLGSYLDFPSLGEETAEILADLVDEKLAAALRKRLAFVVRRLPVTIGDPKCD